MPSLIDIGRSIFQYFVGALTTILGFSLILIIGGFLVLRFFRIDPIPYMDTGARILSGGRLIQFDEVFDTSSSSPTRICEVDRVDTDGDGFKEWLVFYQVDTARSRGWQQPCTPESPRLATIFDNDRGDPPVIFPYALELPDGAFLSTGNQGVDFEEIVANFADHDDPIPELLIYGSENGITNRLSVFKYRENTEDWDNPTDNPPRYQLMGHFQGNGGVEYDSDNHSVTVLDSGNDGGRSQMAVKSVYQLQEDNGTYYTDLGAANAGIATLSAPTASSIDFENGPPLNLTETIYPEKIVMGFLQALNSQNIDELPWTINDLVVPGSVIDQEYRNGNLQVYLGLPNNTQTLTDLAITHLQYYPRAEEAEAQVSDFGSTYTGSRVDARFTVKQDGQDITVIVKFGVVNYQGQWKIEQVL